MPPERYNLRYDPHHTPETGYWFCPVCGGVAYKDPLQHSGTFHYNVVLDYVFGPNQVDPTELMLAMMNPPSRLGLLMEEV